MNLFQLIPIVCNNICVRLTLSISIIDKSNIVLVCGLEMFLLVCQCDGVEHRIESDVVDEEEAQDHGEEDSKEDNPELFEEGGEYHRPDEVHTKNY